MKKLTRILAMFLICIISSISLVGCGGDGEGGESLGRVGEVFAEAFDKLSEVKKYAQEITYERYVNGVQDNSWDTTDLPTLVVTNMSVNDASTTKEIIYNRNIKTADFEKRQVLTDNGSFVCVMTYNLTTKKYKHEDRTHDYARDNYYSVNGYKADVISKLGAYDFDFNAYFKNMLRYYQNIYAPATGEYSSDSKEEVLTYTIKLASTKISYTVTYKHSRVESFVYREQNMSSSGTYTLIKSTFRYDGGDLNLSTINHSEYTKEI